VTISQAQYDPDTNTLTVVATSSDKGFLTDPPPMLTLEGFPAVLPTPLGTDPAQARFIASGVTIPPSFIRVISQAGGRDDAEVEMTHANIPFPAGVPLAVDDFATVVQGGASVSIDALVNDVAITATSVLSIVPPLATLGTVTVDPTTKNIIYQPGPNIGTDTVRYTVSNAVGTSNVGVVTVEVAANPAGPVPTAVNDGPISVFPNIPKVIDVLLNDNANGGALNPASVAIVTSPASGTAAVNTDGTITFTASAALGTVTFTYTVGNVLNPAPSNTATVTVEVQALEVLTVTRSQCRRVGANGDWTVRGTSSVSTGNSITVLNGSGTFVGTVPVAVGAWALSVRGGPACTPRATVQSTVGTILTNVSVTVR